MDTEVRQDLSARLERIFEALENARHALAGIGIVDGADKQVIDLLKAAYDDANAAALHVQDAGDLL